MNEGRATPQQVSMAKRNSCEIAANIARDARQMLGGMGITGEYSIMRHMMNLESVITYEGTHDMHLLITGMDVTGLNAFKIADQLSRRWGNYRLRKILCKAVRCIA